MLGVFLSQLKPKHEPGLVREREIILSSGVLRFRHFDRPRSHRTHLPYLNYFVACAEVLVNVDYAKSRCMVSYEVGVEGTACVSSSGLYQCGGSW